jgi:NAD(P)-dependent dehydrogenase (short-subunit alcohol dehydrogenase family)
MKQAGQPEKLAPAYVFMASQDSSFVTGAFGETGPGLCVYGLSRQ